MSLIPHDLDDELEAILAARRRGTVYLTVDGTPIVGVPIEDLIGQALDEAAAAMPDRLWEMFPDQP